MPLKKIHNVEAINVSEFEIGETTLSNMDCQIFRKYSTVDCKYSLFLHDIFFLLKPKQNKKCQYCRLFKKIWKLIKQNKLFDGIFDALFDDPYMTE